MSLKIAVLGSTRGSNLEPLLRAIKTKELATEIRLVISDRPDALILERAKNLGLLTSVLPGKGQSREEYGIHLDAVLKQHEIDLVVLIGFMRILAAEFTDKWKGKVLNVHPSLLPKHAGLMDLQVHAAVIAAGESESGCTVHAVEAVVDGGKILVQKRCALSPSETPESLKAKVQALEVPALIEAIQHWLFQKPEN